MYGQLPMSLSAGWSRSGLQGLGPGPAVRRPGVGLLAAAMGWARGRRRAQRNADAATDATNSATQLFATVYDEHWGDLMAYCRRRCASETDAEDVLAETFAIAWRKIDEIPAGASVRPWLFGVARNLLREHYRRGDWTAGITERLMGELITAPNVPIPGEHNAAMDLDVAISALAGLDEADRELIQLIAWDRVSHDEAAEVLGCTANAVAIRLHRARTRLTARFDELSFGEVS